jgi:hypothetical protein
MTKLAFAYRAAHDNLVAHNTFVACDTVFQWTKKNIPMKHIREKMGLVDRHGPFLAKLWEEETSRYREGDFVEPMYPPRRWFVLNNVILNTPQLVRVKLARGTRPPVQEEEFRWQGNLGFLRDGEFDVGPARQFSEQQFRFADPGLSEEGSGIFRPGATSICRGQAKLDRDAIKPYVDRPEIAAVLEKLSDLGASGWRMLAIADVGPRAETDFDAGDD